MELGDRPFSIADHVAADWPPRFTKMVPLEIGLKGKICDRGKPRHGVKVTRNSVREIERERGREIVVMEGQWIFFASLYSHSNCSQLSIVSR